VKGNPSDPM